MKRRLINAFVAISNLTLVACVNEVQFESPQPEGLADEVLMPASSWGIYRSAADSSYLFISAEEVVRFTYKVFSAPRSSLDSAYQIKGDTLLFDEENRLTVEVHGDSVFGAFHRADTVFSMSPQNVLRKYKGYYFLNNKTINGWEVYLMSIKKNDLSLITTWKKEDLEALREITHTSDNAHHFKPTRRQIRKFLMRHAFPAGEKFHRVTEPPMDNLDWKRIITGTVIN